MGFRMEADRNMSCQAGLVEEVESDLGGSEYGTSSINNQESLSHKKQSLLQFCSGGDNIYW